MGIRYFSTFDAARICHVSPGSMIRWIREGRLSAAKTAGGHHRILDSDLVGLLRSLQMPVPTELGGSGTAQPAPAAAQETDLLPRILIVDDEKDVCQLIRQILEVDLKAVKVLEAHDGFEAGWKAHQFKPHLVILDLMLPGMDGFHVCRFIRNISELKDTRILAISGLNLADKEKKIKDLGADDFLEKPFDLELLKSKVNRLLNGSSWKGGAA